MSNMQYLHSMRAKVPLNIVNITACTSRMLYLTLVRSVIDYSSPAWANAKPKIVNKLQVVQNWALRVITGAPWFVRNTTLHNDLQIEYMQEHLKKKSQKFYEDCANSVHPQIQRIGNYQNRHYKYSMPKEVINL